MLLSDFEDDMRIDVWPENWTVVCFFADIPNGAWNVGTGGVVGLRPEALREVRESMGVTPEAWRAMYRDLMTMENEAIKTMNRSVSHG